MHYTANLNSYDVKILRKLAEDGRISWRDLADEIGLSATPTLRRVHRLEEEKYILGYGVRLDEIKLGHSISVFVMVTLGSQSEEALRAFEHNLTKFPEVMSCFMMTGDADYMLRVVVPDINAYQTFLVNKLTRVPGISHIKSSFALKPVLQRATPPLS